MACVPGDFVDGPFFVWGLVSFDGGVHAHGFVWVVMLWVMVVVVGLMRGRVPGVSILAGGSPRWYRS